MGLNINTLRLPLVSSSRIYADRSDNPVKMSQFRHISDIFASCSPARIPKSEAEPLTSLLNSPDF